MPRIVREQAPQIAIVGFGRVDEIKRMLFLVIFAECLGERAERINLFTMRKRRTLTGYFLHQFVDEFEFFKRRPIGITRAPVGPWTQPYCKRLGEILIGMALRVP